MAISKSGMGLEGDSLLSDLDLGEADIDPRRLLRHFRPICMYRLLFANDFWHVLGSRSYVSGLFVGSRAVALLGLRTRRDLISGKVHADRMGRQILRA